jgi:hypothetical protein
MHGSADGAAAGLLAPQPMMRGWITLACRRGAHLTLGVLPAAKRWANAVRRVRDAAK